MKFLILAALGAVIVTGCSPDKVAAPSRLRLMPANRASLPKDEFVTTGGAATEITFKKNDFTNRLSFVAHHLTDGVTSDGEFEYTGLLAKEGPPPKDCKPDQCLPTIIETEIHVHGLVQCFLLVGKGFKSAAIEGVITQSDDGTLEGTPVMWDVADNGEGANDPPDMSSILTAGKTGCVKPALLQVFSVESGNVQVHPAQ
jgi:hypothetical protein